MKKLLLLDGNHLMHRAYWAIQRTLKTSTGEQTNAVFGVASMLLTMLSRERPDAVVACFDEGKETFRHKQHLEYKAGRAETPDDFYVQIPRVRQCFESFAIPILSDLEYEADDLLGTLALKAVSEGYEVVIITGDRDLFQMAGAGIRIAVPHKGYTDPEYLDQAGVERKLGVKPAQVPDYKGLTGDASDNLKGVQGIGPKTAVELLSQFGTLEGVYEHLSDIRENIRKKLEHDRESAFFCRKLARIITDVPHTLSLREVEATQIPIDVLNNFFTSLEFHTLRTRLKKFLLENSYAKRRFTERTELDGSDEESLNGVKVTEAELPMLD